MNQALLVAWLVAQTSPHTGVEAASKNQDLPVRLLPAALVKTMSELEVTMTRSWASTQKISFNVREGGKKQRWTKIKNCGELNKIDARAAETKPADAWDALSGVSYWCRGLQAVARAKPSKRSFLGDVLASKNPAAFIPGSVVDVINEVDSEEEKVEASKGKLSHASIAWTVMDPSLTLHEVQRKDAISVLGKDWVGGIELYAAGDFNGDSVEDLLVEINVRPFDASQGDGAFFILTRTKPEGILTIIETFR